MAWKLLVCALVCAAVASGCDVFRQLARRTADELEYHREIDETLVMKSYRAMARSAWDEFAEADPDTEYSSHFAAGFKDGFVEYLHTGVDEPPVLPPRHYWRVFYRSEEGQAEMQDWFAGYRFGVVAAEQSGERNWVKLPMSRPVAIGRETAAAAANGTAAEPQALRDPEPLLAAPEEPDRLELVPPPMSAPAVAPRAGAGWHR